MSVSSTIAVLSATVLSSHNKHKRLDTNDINAENYKDYLIIQTLKQEPKLLN